jgi:hypothetical protein
MCEVSSETGPTRKEKEMTVKQLIQELYSCPPDAKVYFYIDATRYEAYDKNPIDDSFVVEKGFIDINLVP